MTTKILLLTIVNLFIFLQSNGQDQESLTNKSGIYMTATDFLSGKLTYEINCLTTKQKIKTTNFFNTKTVKVTNPDSTIKLSKSSIWGFRLCDGNEYRFYQGKEYLIIDKGAITVYQIIERSGTSPKSNQSVSKTRYFFSEDANSSLKELTLKNVETSITNNKKFHDLIDLYFKTDVDLLIYDDYYKMLRLNHIYNESLK
ncbi:MAG: hypothetical protein HY951_01150 [Bacteroidia bacterium]|nr:hypothetical protein [Bacteroidia bacterium]